MRALTGALICSVVLSALVPGCASESVREEALPAPPPAPIFDNLVVPGQRIGPVSLGMTGGELIKALGPPEKSVAFAGGSWNVFSNGAAAFVEDSNNRVSRLETMDTRFATKEGLRVGSAALEVRSLLGPPSKVTDHQELRVVCYYGLEFGQISGRVTKVYVYPSQRGC